MSEGIPGAQILGQVIKLTEGYVVVSGNVTVAARSPSELGRKVRLMAEASNPPAPMPMPRIPTPCFEPEVIAGGWPDPEPEVISAVPAEQYQYQRDNLRKLCEAYVSDDIDAGTWRDGVAQACPDLEDREVGEALDSVLAEWQERHSAADLAVLNTDPELGDTTNDPDVESLDGKELRQIA